MSIAIDNLDYATSEVPHWEDYMEPHDTAVDVEALKKDIK